MVKPDLIFTVPLSIEEALWRAHQALKAIGSEVSADYSRGTIKSKVIYVTRPVEVTVRVKPSGTKAKVSVETLAFELSNSYSDSVVSRFREAFDNFDKPGYTPDTIGVSRSTIIVLIVIGIAVAILLNVLHLGK